MLRQKRGQGDLPTVGAGKGEGRRLPLTGGAEGGEGWRLLLLLLSGGAGEDEERRLLLLLLTGAPREDDGEHDGRQENNAQHGQEPPDRPSVTAPQVPPGKSAHTMPG